MPASSLWTPRGCTGGILTTNYDRGDKHMRFNTPLEDLLGLQVLNIHQPRRTGTVVSTKEENLPLIGVDCGEGFVRMIPVQDLGVVGVYPRERVVDVNL